MARALRFTYVCCGDVDCNCDRTTVAAKESTATDSTTGEQLLRSLGKSELCFDNRSSLSGSPISPPQSDPDPFAEHDQVSPMLTRSLGTAPLKGAARAREREGERERECGRERESVNWTATQNSCALDPRQAPADSYESGIELPGQAVSLHSTSDTLHFNKKRMP